MYRVKNAILTDESGNYKTVEEALSRAADYMRESPDAVALVMDDSSEEAVTVLHNNWVYLATEKPA